MRIWSRPIAARGRAELEYELIDTGVFDEDRYFDVFVEYAKAGPEDMLIEITVHNRGPESAELHLLPTLWFRNPWSWGGDRRTADAAPDRLRARAHRHRRQRPQAGQVLSLLRRRAELLFTENETNTQRLFGTPNRSPYVKDGINNYVVEGKAGAVNPAKRGTKAAAHYRLTLASGRMEEGAPAPDRDGAGPGARQGHALGRGFDGICRLGAPRPMNSTPPSPRSSLSDDQALVMRQALARHAVGQAVLFLRRRQMARRARRRSLQARRQPAPRNDQWHHMYNGDIISMPDKWEYPWYAAWDLAFHVLALTLVDPDFGKQQLNLMLRERYLHPNGQIPAYEWNFSDVNPPVHAWSTIFTYRLAKARTRQGRSGMARASLPETAAELHLVGQPQGPRRPQRLRGRLPRHGQYRRLRPQRAAAHRRLSRAGRRHRLDGAVLPEDAGDRPRAGASRSRPMRIWR